MFPSTSDEARATVRSTRTAIRNLADLAIAFVTLESYALDDLQPARRVTSHGHPDGRLDDAAASTGPGPSPRAAVESINPHRRELRTPTRTRRPGTTMPLEQLCLTPILGATPTSTPTPPSSRRRTAPQDASH